MSLTIPNQILHYTASSPGYPPHAIRVGNFAFSDAGNNPTGAWGTFRGGLNPQAFQSSVSGITGFEDQTYVVYIHKDSINNCFGPSCYLITDAKDIPNADQEYVGASPPYKPWYNLIKFTQYFSGYTGSGISPQIGLYTDGLVTDINISRAKLVTTFKWYADQLITDDANSYLGGTAGNRVVVNKFYPPIIANTASRIFDSSFIPSTPMVPGAQLTGKIYNLAGLTHGNIGSSNELLGDWDFEGGYFVTSGGGLLAFEIPSDTGFCMSSGLEPTNWTLNMYVMATNHGTNYNNFFVKSGGQPDTSTMYWGLGYRNTGSNTKLTMSWNRQDGVNSRQDYTLDSATISLNTWYFISVVRTNNSDWKTYINGKWIHTNNPSPANFAGPFTNISQATASVLYHLNSATENAYKNFQYFSYYPVNYGDDAIRENFLRYALNSKIRNSNIKIALDTGTKTSTPGATQWTDISGNDLHGTNAFFTWQGHKPTYTAKQITITHKSVINNFFTAPFCLSLWVRFGNISTDSAIFSKGRNTIELGSLLISFDFRATDDGTSGRWTYTTPSSPTSNRWYNIFVTGLNLATVNVYIFSHNGSNQDLVSGQLLENNPGNPTADDTSNIVIGETNNNVEIASVIYWNTRFSQALCNDFFAIQKGRFGEDSNENRIADLGSCT